MNSGMKFEEGSLEEAAYQPQATPSMIDTPKYYGTSGVLALQKKTKQAQNGRYMEEEGRHMAHTAARTMKKQRSSIVIYKAQAAALTCDL